MNPIRTSNFMYYIYIARLMVNFKIKLHYQYTILRYVWISHWHCLRKKKSSTKPRMNCRHYVMCDVNSIDRQLSLGYVGALFFSCNAFFCGCYMHSLFYIYIILNTSFWVAICIFIIFALIAANISDVFLLFYLIQLSCINSYLSPLMTGWLGFVIHLRLKSGSW